MSSTTRIRKVASPTLSRKLGLTLLIAGVLVVVLGALVVYNLNLARIDALKFMDETREARLADNLVTHLEQTQASWPAAQQLPVRRIVETGRRLTMFSARFQNRRNEASGLLLGPYSVNFLNPGVLSPPTDGLC